MQIFTGLIVILNKLILMFDYETLRKNIARNAENLLIILTILACSSFIIIY